jgi:hypothetical protein
VEQHPNVYDPVVLRDHADREFATRVEDLGERLVVVAQPPGLPADETFSNGTELSVAWADADGAVTVLPTRILAVHAEGRLQLWSLVVTGPAFTEQRRRVERVDAAGPVALRSPEGDESDAVTGSLIDASEKAIRCSVGAGSADRFLGHRNEVIAEFSLGTADFAVPGRVEFVRSTKRPTQFEDLVVVFDEPVADADALRKHLFAREVRTPPTQEEDDRF